MLQKQNIPINFSQGLDLKTDPFQVSLGKFLSLQNSVFDVGGLLKKRNGYLQLTSLPDNTSTFLTTYNGGLTAIGSSLRAYSAGTQTWVNRGSLQPLSLSTSTLVRSGTNQPQADAAIASNGLVCTVYTDNLPGSTAYKYVIADSTTGQIVAAPTLIPAGAGAVSGSPRVFILGGYFVIVFTNTISATPHLQYFAVSTTNPAITVGPTDIATSYAPTNGLSWDGVVANQSLFIAYNTTTGGQAVKIAFLTSTFTLSLAATYAGQVATSMAVSADLSNPSSPIIWASYFDTASSTGHTFAVDKFLNPVLAPTQWASSGIIVNVTSSPNNSVNTIFYEVQHAYSYDSSIPTNFVNKITCTQGGSVGSPSVVMRSVGLASKTALVNGVAYFLSAYQSAYQPTYFLLDSSGNIISKLAYSNGDGYLTLGLPSVTVSGNEFSTAYLFKDLIQAVNKNTNVPSGTQVNGIYAQTGINLANFTIGVSGAISTSEIGENLNIAAGFVWAYDGVKPVEQGFFVWPDNVESTANATTGGHLSAQIYFYQATYEWADNQGNLFRSAPSIPIKVDLTGSGTSTNTITLAVPTLRLTYKTLTPVKIVLYRWSTAQQEYYQVTSITNPLLNDTTVDSVSFTDTLADATILGNNLIYTTGGVLENISPPAADVVTLFNNRLFLVDSEDKNLLWFSKQIIESTPVEMSDLLTIFVAPTTAAQGATGPITAMSAMDDKLILFKRDAIYYISGTGPDNTGSNSQYTDPAFITSTVGSTNQHSIVFTPQGLMFQSDKGIWLLGRDLGTQYIGAPVETLTQSALVQSAVNVPGTNQVRFTLDSGITLMYDYYYGQWGTFTNVPAISSTLFEALHTYINSLGQAFQESPGVYLDGSKPVLMNFTTGWLNLAGLQGFQRAYEFYLLGVYKSPHKLNVSIAFDYAPGPSQTTLISPTNFNPAYGGDPLYGSGSPYGGALPLEQWRVFLDRQKCEAFQISLTEVYDPSLGVAAGAGLTLSGIDLTVGVKLGRPKLAASQYTG